MNSQSDFQVSFDFFPSKTVVVEPSAAQVSSDAGLLPFRQLDERLGLTQQFAEALMDRRHVGYVDHTFLEMTRSRIYGILADYPDQNDHDVLRSDPVFKLICDRSIDDQDLASLLCRGSKTRLTWARSFGSARCCWISSSPPLRSRRAGSLWISTPSTIPRTASNN